MGSLDAKFSGETFRKDHVIILAQNRHLATLLPVRLEYDAAGYQAGQVLCQNNVSKLFSKYTDSGSSGLDTAQCILFEDHPVEEFASTGDTQLARGIFGGEVFKDKLIGLDANAITDLKARTLSDATGIDVLKF